MKGAAAFLRSVAGWRAMLGLLALLGPLAPRVLDAAQEEFPERQVTQGPYYKLLQDVSPDGGTFYYVSRCLTSETLCVLAIPVAGGQPREIAPYIDLTSGTSRVTVSPDGNWVLVDSGNTLKKYPTAGGDPVVLQDGKSNNDVSWSPDGASVLFRTEGTGMDGTPYNMLYRVPADGSRAVSQLFTQFLEGPLSSPQWGRDGTSVFFTHCSSGYVTCRIARVPGDGSGTLTYLTSEAAYYQVGSLSPDGRMATATVAYRCQDPMQRSFSVLELLSWQELESFCSVASDPREDVGLGAPWHPSSRGYFLVEGVSNALLRYRRIGGGFGSTVLKGGSWIRWVRPGPNGRWVAYVRRDAQGVWQIYVLDISALVAEVPALGGVPSAVSVAGLVGLGLLRGALVYGAGGR